jgi:hypothetical protein
MLTCLATPLSQIACCAPEGQLDAEYHRTCSGVAVLDGRQVSHKTPQSERSRSFPWSLDGRYSTSTRDLTENLVGV